MTKPRVVLIEPPCVKVVYEGEGRSVVCSAVRTHYPKQSLLTVEAYVREQFDVSIVDMKIRDAELDRRWKEFPYGSGCMSARLVGAGFDCCLEKIAAADIVGISSNFTWTSGAVVELISFIRRHFPAKPIIVGGVDATLRYRFYLDRGADLVALGNIDRAFAEMLRLFICGASPDRYDGIAYWRNGEIIVRPPVRSGRYRIPLDETPLPTYDLFGKTDLSLYRESPEGPFPEGVVAPYAFLITSMGCSRSCSFCSVPRLHGKYRFMSIGRIERELEHLTSAGISTIVLMEDNLLSRLDFPGGEETLLEMFRLMRSHGFAWEFGNGLEIGKFLDENGSLRSELMESLFYSAVISGKRVGAYRMYVPLEALEDSPNLIYDKLRTYEEEKMVIEAIASTGVPMMTIGVIVGRPDASASHFAQAERRCLEIRRLVESHGVDPYFSTFIMTALPGTLDMQYYESFLEYSIEAYPELYQFHSAAMRTPDMSAHGVTMRKIMFDGAVNGSESAGRWGRDGKYSFHHHPWSDG